ncbi:MAG: crossover junction endodeoxyribonuclease RuvC, partial [Candidatus Caldatribacteriota bacterium]|nr:crossover junction endodeoxyribonuclease RuvC [Candidatus Caldatribacteriota bacterium]
MPEEEIIIAIDPGTKKCGYAVVDSNLSVLQREVISTNEITQTIEDGLNIYKIDKIILGNGTNYKKIEE